MEVPASWLVQQDEPMRVTCDGEETDLRERARALERSRARGRIECGGAGGPSVVLERRKRARRTSSTLEVELGGAISMQVDLVDGWGSGAIASLEEALQAAGGWKLEGLNLGEAELIESLRQMPPTRILEIATKEGTALSVRTR